MVLDYSTTGMAWEGVYKVRLILGLTILFHQSLRKYSKTCVKRPLPKRPKIGFPDKLKLNVGQKYCRIWSILQYFRPSLSYHLSLKIFVLSIFEWLFYTGFTVQDVVY